MGKSKHDSAHEYRVRWRQGKGMVAVDRDILALVDHHAKAVGVSRRTLVCKTLEQLTADTAAMLAAQEIERLEDYKREGES